MNFGEVEEQEMWRKKSTNNSKQIFSTAGSAGSNPEKLAQILSAWDFTMIAFGWQDKPIANLSHVITQYQASLGGQYHNDYKTILIAEEIEKRRANSKGISINNRSD